MTCSAWIQIIAEERLPGLAELAYSTVGGVAGAAATSYLTRHHERRQLRAGVMEGLHTIAAVTAGVHDVEIGWAPVHRAVGGRSHLTSGLGLRATLDGGVDAELALREAFAGFGVAALAAGIPRRVMDFAAGSHERAFECEVIRIIDRRVGGVLGDSVDELMRVAEEYRRAATGLLLHTLWHPWRARLNTRARIRALRTDVAALHELQETARARLVEADHVALLFARLDPGERRWETWKISPDGGTAAPPAPSTEPDPSSSR
ncbi:hypothetical protein GCM10023196_045680 [Actinoallomurus vinaceus]|uniref:Uncharacterized protein n=1 Tax=Actinoallomurus vinaceus TaxID=1080074 RepID=A0ABP8UBV4_9ACTN